MQEGKGWVWAREWEGCRIQPPDITDSSSIGGDLISRSDVGVAYRSLELEQLALCRMIFQAAWLTISFRLTLSLSLMVYIIYSSLSFALTTWAVHLTRTIANILRLHLLLLRRLALTTLSICYRRSFSIAFNFQKIKNWNKKKEKNLLKLIKIINPITMMLNFHIFFFNLSVRSFITSTIKSL